MSTIRRILDWGEWHTVIFDCGHRKKLRRAQVKDQQLYLGKKVECSECKTKGQRRWAD